MSYFDKIAILDDSGNEVGVQYPLSTDGDSIYSKDIDTAYTSMGGFSGSITDLFDDLHTTVTDSSASNPKSITVVLKRPVDTGVFRLCTGVNNFSNVKIILKDRAGTAVGTIDDSSNSTKYTANEYAITPVPFCTMLIEFHTADTVSLDFIAVDKSIHAHAQLMAIKPDGTSTYIDATAGGNLKVSLEEVESDVLVDDMLKIAKGGVTGHSVVNKFGSNPDATAAATEEVWDGATAYTFPTSASITHIRAGVDSATTRSVNIEVQGLDTNYALVVQTATTDATDSTTEVALTTALRRVFRMKVLDASVLDQEIWAGPTGFASKQAIIQTGKNQTLMAIYTVPASYTAYITSYYCDYVRDAVKDPDAVEYQLWMRDNNNGYAKQIKHQKGIPKQAGGFQHDFKPYYKATEKTDIYVTASPTGADAHCHAGFDIILVAN